ncbi:hypothetical protein BJ878DRAFT_509497 [Calycina marina]|uniref:Uncharacterized protein n=1 Tax=Calycina marina TaxID=1763456 RepID=A0A9P8CE42_9HELO|nr:hypothetical protein BJ878DRAFT_509497 [Calycina marina]
MADQTETPPPPASPALETEKTLTPPPHLPIPSPQAHPPVSSLPLPTASTEVLKSWLPLYLSRTDRALTVLSQLLSTHSGTDTVLMTLCYTTLLSSSLLSSISLAAIKLQIRRVLKIASDLPVNTTLVVDMNTIPTSRVLVTAKRFKALSALISDVRIFARMFGLVGIYHWGKGVVADKAQDQMIRRITLMQVVMNVAFQTLENGAYLSSKGVLGWSLEKQNKAWLWSCRFWMAHVVLDFGRLVRERQVRRGGDEREKEAKLDRAWLKQMVVNASWFPLTLHWSLDGGLLSDTAVGAFGSVCGLFGLQALLAKA